MTAWTFLLRDLDGQVIGAALLCPDARYCSLQGPHSARPARRFLQPPAWAAVIRELRAGLPPTRLDGASAIRALFRDLTDDVTYLSALPIETESPFDVAPALDTLLASQAIVRHGA